MQEGPRHSKESLQKTETSVTVSPDGGWGWYVVAGAFIINVITDGCSYSFGVLFATLIEYFSTSRSKTAWIGSIFCAAPLLFGPIAGMISNKIGYRKATILGGVITSIGFSMSYFVNSVEELCITYGIIAGFGISLPYLNSIVAVAEYFEKKRALATGLAECGAGIGTLIFAPLLERLIVEYGWRGAVLIIGGLSSNIIVCGSFFRPIHNTVQSTEDKNSEQPLIESICKQENHAPLASNMCHPENCDTIVEESMFVDYSRKQKYLNVVNVNAHISDNTILGGSTASIPHLIRASKTYPSVNSLVQRPSFKCPKNLVHLSVLKNRSFLLLIISNFILYFWYDVPYVFTVDRAKLLGTTKASASIMVSVIGILHTIGNILYGFLGDRSWINREFLYCFSLVQCGATLICVPFFKDFVPSTIIAGLFGLFSAAPEALCSVIIVDILGIKKLTDAFGIMMFLQGSANLIGPPSAGWLYDISGEYRMTFLAAGISIAVAGCVYLIVPLCTLHGKVEDGTNPELNTSTAGH